MRQPWFLTPSGPRPHTGRPTLSSTGGAAAAAPALDPGVVMVVGELPTRWSGPPSWQTAAATGNANAVLEPLWRKSGGMWFGWPEERAARPTPFQQGPATLKSLGLSAKDDQDAIGGFRDSVLWPLFHGFPGECRFEPAFWQGYRRLNGKVARAVARALLHHDGPIDRIWVHDPLLLNVAAELEHLGYSTPAALFLHLPFPGPDLFLQLPWRNRLLTGILAHRQVGFLSTRDLVNFVDCVRDMAPGVQLASAPSGMVHLSGNFGAARFDLQAGAFPVGIDAATVHELAATPEVEQRVEELRRSLGNLRVVLGVDPLRHTEGLLAKLAAFAELLEHRTELQGQVTLIQIVVPEKQPTAAAQSLRHEIERQIGAINGKFARVGWQPVHYRYQMLSSAELLAHYRVADTMLLTPVREGMSLVAKEFCAAQLEDRGVLVLSEFAGSAPELATGAIVINPHAVAATARALLGALRLGPAERTLRMRRMRHAVQQRTAFWWAESFLRVWGGDPGDEAGTLDAQALDLPAVRN
jgi:trehalose-6-phosphate synthase